MNTRAESRKEQVLRLLDTRGEMKRAEMLEEVEMSASRLDNVLGALRDSGDIIRVGRGRYDLPSQGRGNVENDATKELTLHDDEGKLASLFDRDIKMRIHTEARVSAGSGRIIYPDKETHEVSLPAGFLQQILGFRPPSRIGVTWADGDSMEPTIKADDLIIYEPIEEIRDSGIYVINLTHGNVVKRVQPRADGSYRIISDNSYHDYINDTLVPHNGGFRMQETGRTAQMHPVGRVLFPDRDTSQIHIQQAGKIIQSAIRGNGDLTSQLNA